MKFWFSIMASIIERGRHAELITQNGHYASMWSKQREKLRSRRGKTQSSRERPGCRTGRDQVHADDLDELNPVDFDAFGAVPRRIADALLGFHYLHA